MLLVDTDHAVATFTLNRPERLNAITPDLIDALDAALAEALADGAVRVIRLRGAGRAFCAGYDLEWAAALMRDDDPWDPAADFRVMSRYVNSYMALWRSPKPVVAQVHGVCVGGGSCARRTLGSAIRRRACGARRRRRCGSTGSGSSARSGYC
jgi:enoyl-CoA hydratase